MRNRAWLYAITIIIAGGCSGPPKITDDTIQKVLYPELIDMLDNPGKHPPILVDVRSAQLYKEGHIPGAINISFVELIPQNPALAGKGPVIVYSGTWSDYLSASAAKKLMNRGMDPDRVYDFRGGMDYWVKSDGNISKR